MKIYSPDRVEEYLADITKKNNEIYEKITKGHFLCKELIEYEFLYLNDEELKFVLKTFIKYGFIHNNDLELLANEIRSSNFVEFKRTTPWHFSEINVLDSSGEIISYGYCKANFHLINKWDFKSNDRMHRIIYDKKTLTVLWANFGDLFVTDINKNIEDSERYISHNHNVYKIEYIQVDLYIMESPDVQRTILKGLNNDLLDEYINHVCEKTINSGHGFILDIEHAKVVDIEDFLGKEFFDNGPEWKHGKYIMYKGTTATDIKDIIAEKNLFKIIIENNTYKNTRIKTIYLDIENFALLFYQKQMRAYPIFCVNDRIS